MTKYMDKEDVININDIVFLSDSFLKYYYDPCDDEEVVYEGWFNYMPCENDPGWLVYKYLGNGRFMEMLTGYIMVLPHSRICPATLIDGDKIDNRFIELTSDYDSTIDEIYVDRSATSDYPLEAYYEDLVRNKEMCVADSIIVISDDGSWASVDDEEVRKEYFKMTDEQRIEILNKVKNECEESAAIVVKKIDEILDKRQSYVPKEDLENAYFENQIYDFRHGKVR